MQNSRTQIEEISANNRPYFKKYSVCPAAYNIVEEMKKKLPL
jgi:sulfur relay (sulfurtransferase) DsrC/TusE family protein